MSEYSTAASAEVCPDCGAAKRDGVCVSCLLREGLQGGGEPSAETFEAVLTEAKVPDTSWQLGNYQILEEIGRGGMGVIYRARQRHSRRIVALKRVLAHHSDSHETLVRFRREAEAAAKLDHPNILPVYEVGESEDGLPFFSMKYAPGGSLRKAMPSLRDQPRECVRLMSRVARAIAHAHEQGILHRDLQPGNILLDAQGEPLVSDFGLAKWLLGESDLTHSLTTFGTPGYIAPEQAESAGDELTPAADVYSLGAVLFHLLAGRPPFVGTNVLAVVRQAATNPAPPLRSIAPQLDRDLETICACCLERDPGARYQSASDLAAELERWLDGRPILARPVSVHARAWRWSHRNPGWATAAVTILVLGVIVSWLLWNRQESLPQVAAPEKSIAVLPFENIGQSKENADFANGIQDDILTSLAQIRALKVVSRTSVMRYREPGRRDVRQIGRELGVANVLEGSVRRADNRVLVNVQLIDTRNDRHLWAQRYDRSVGDMIGLQSELAMEIAVALNARLEPDEKTHVAAGMTANSDAYVLYLTGRGKEHISPKAAEELYLRATEIDPKFALAYARASLMNTWMSSYGEHPALNTKARALAEEALRLDPNLGEAHLAFGLHLYWGEKKYDAALKEFEIAAAQSPNDAKIYDYVAGIYRRQGRWRDALISYDRALSLDPRNLLLAYFAGNTHLFVRDWAGAAACYKRGLEISPDGIDCKIQLAMLEVFQNANPNAGQRILQNISSNLDPHGEVALERWDLAMLERDYAGAENILRELPEEKINSADAPKSYHQGRTALARGDRQSAQHYFSLTAPVLEKWVRDYPENADHHALLGLLYAYMRRNEDAIREGRRAVELVPEMQDAFHGAIYAANLAQIYALLNEQDQAIILIERLLHTPGPFPGPGVDCPSDITLADLRLRWEWDSLRRNPRFQKILAGPEPKTVLEAIH